MSVDREGGGTPPNPPPIVFSLSVEKWKAIIVLQYVNNEKEMYCTGESIDTDHRPRTTDDRPQTILSVRWKAIIVLQNT